MFYAEHVSSMSDLLISDKVRITRNPEYYKADFDFEGIIQNIRQEDINLGAKSWGTHNCIYISFGKEAYDVLLLQGSRLFCRVEEAYDYYYITEKDELKVSLVSEMCMPYRLEYQIKLDDIVSILITKKAYIFTKIIS